MDIKHTIAWIIFSVSSLLLWDQWQRHISQPRIISPIVGQDLSTPSASMEPMHKAGSLSTFSVSSKNLPTSNLEHKGKNVTVTTDVLRAKISSVGGALIHLELLKHRDTINPDKNMVLFDSSPTHTYLANTGLVGGSFPNHKSLFKILPGKRTLSDSSNQISLALESDEGGVRLTKIYTLKRGGYSIGVRHVVRNNNNTPITPSLYLQLTRDGKNPKGEQRFVHTFTGASVYTDDEKFQKFSFKDIDGRKLEYPEKSNNGWFALMQHYFVSAFIPQDKAPREIFIKKLSNNLYTIGNILPLGIVAPGAKVDMNAKLYSGPEVQSDMESIAPGLELVKDYGWLTIIAKPIFWLMMQIYKVIGNWGWTIVALTVLIKIVFFPLSATSYRNMAKMKSVAPKIAEIREQFKSEPQKMNKSMMELYRIEKINPLGGCLPIIIQIPVFISLYWVLLASVEIRNASWLGWIHDLAAPDPFYILPAAMTISMFIQAKLNPKPADPVQAKVMMFMPLVFSAMFFFFPSGLVLYWVTNNMLSIAQQWFIKYKMSTDIGKIKVSS
jgi:YidC/Oxa1 family membrane protein insertase